MEPVTDIKIECEGATTLPLDSLVDLQGNLKDLTEENYVKLRNSIVKYGFSFPVFVYKENDQNFILDAHQRIRTLRKMRDEGITIPDLPADIIHAENRTEAKKKLLLLNSRYGKITREGFDEFIDEPEFKIDEEEMNDLLAIPEVEMWNAPTTTNEEEGIPVNAYNRGAGVTNVKKVTCPSCSHEFEI